MNKTTKKLDNNIVKALTIVCERAKVEIPEFLWLTHSADFSNFPSSLLVSCVFTSNQAVHCLKQNKQDIVLIKWIQAELLKVGILLKQAKHNVAFINESEGENLL
jgi:hypothetical protein